MIKINTDSKLNPMNAQEEPQIVDGSVQDSIGSSDTSQSKSEPDSSPDVTFLHYELSADGQPLLVDGESFDAVTFKESASKVLNSLSEDKRQAFLVKVCAAFGLPTDFAAAPKDEVLEVASVQGEKIASLSDQPLSEGGVLRTGERMALARSETDDEADEYDFEEMQ